MALVLSVEVVLCTTRIRDSLDCLCGGLTLKGGTRIFFHFVKRGPDFFRVHEGGQFFTAVKGGGGQK